MTKGGDNMTKQHIMGVVTALTIFATSAGMLPVYAATDTSRPNFFQNIVDAMVQKFGLDKTQVQAFVDEFRSTERQKMQDFRKAKMEDHLSQLVKNGKLKEAQKQLIVSKMADMQKNRVNYMSLTPDQRKAAMEKEKADLESWAKQNNIDLSILPFGRLGHMGGMRGKWKK